MKRNSQRVSDRPRRCERTTLASLQPSERLHTHTRRVCDIALITVTTQALRTQYLP